MAAKAWGFFFVCFVLKRKELHLGCPAVLGAGQALPPTGAHSSPVPPVTSVLSRGGLGLEGTVQFAPR